MYLFRAEHLRVRLHCRKEGMVYEDIFGAILEGSFVVLLLDYVLEMRLQKHNYPPILIFPTMTIFLEICPFSVYFHIVYHTYI